MTHADPFLKAIIDQPDDDGLRLIAADFLDESGQPERAEFVRVQVALARLPPKPARHHERCREERPYVCCALCEWSIVTFDRQIALRRRERELLDGVCGLGVEALPVVEGLSRTNFAGRGGYGWHRRENASPETSIEAAFRRGFVEVIECTAADWLAHADALTAAAPIRAVRLTRTIESEGAAQFHALASKRGMLHDWGGRVQDWDGYVLRVFAVEWPRIAFTVPPVATVSWGGQRLGDAASVELDIPEAMRRLRDRIVRDA